MKRFLSKLKNAQLFDAHFCDRAKVMQDPLFPVAHVASLISGLACEGVRFFENLTRLESRRLQPRRTSAEWIMRWKKSTSNEIVCLKTGLAVFRSGAKEKCTQEVYGRIFMDNFIRGEGGITSEDERKKRDRGFFREKFLCASGVARKRELGRNERDWHKLGRIEAELLDLVWESRSESCDVLTITVERACGMGYPYEI